MPLYTFLCDDCGPFDLSRRIADRDTPAECPTCEAEATRVMTSPRLLGMGGDAAAPQEGGYGRLRHAGPCNCC